MGGLGVGILSGLFVAAIVLAGVSLNTPLPPRPGAADVANIEDAEAPQSAEVVTEEAEAPAPAADGAEADPAPIPETGEVPAVEGEPDGVDALPGEDGNGPGDAAPTDDAAPSEGAAPQEDAAAPEAGAPQVAPEPAPVEEQAESGSAPATDIPLPAGSEFNRPPPEDAAALPALDAAPNSATPAAPATGGLVAAPSFDTAPPVQPDVVTEAPEAGAAPALGAAPVAPSAAPGVAIATGPSVLRQPTTSAAPQVEASAAPVPQAAPDPGSATAPEPEEPVAVAAEAVEAEAVESEATLPQTSRFPTIGDNGEAAADAAVTDVLRFPQVSRLPQAGGATEADAEAVEGAEAQTEVAAPDDLPAIEAFAAPFDASEARPLMAVVLIDEPDSRIELDTLTRFTFPVAFAVDALHPEAAARAQAYRAAGFEVVMLGSMLPGGATAMDTEVALSAAQAVLPEAVALLDTPDSRIQGDRTVLDATIDLLAESGHGLVAFPRGLNAAEQSARRVDVPAATVFRLLDDENERATQITRFLARAAFAAGQEETVIVVGHTRPDTVTALFSWALGDRSEGIALAPLSAVLLRASGR